MLLSSALGRVLWKVIESGAGQRVTLSLILPQQSDLSDTHGLLRATANIVELSQSPDLRGATILGLAAHRLVEGKGASEAARGA